MKFPTLICLAALAGIPMLDGCSSGDTGGKPTEPPLLATPEIMAEPEFTAGTTNEVEWVDAGSDGYQVQQSTAPDFSVITGESDRITGTRYTFSNLEHGATYYYRVRVVDVAGNTGLWSDTRVSTQDARPPVTCIASLDADQTSLTCTLELSAEDDLSGVGEIDLWYAANGGELRHQGAFPPGPVTFTAAEQGTFGFFTTAADTAGNRSEIPVTAQATTRVPEPIIITDVTGEDFDITNAVLKHNMAQAYWQFGLGRRAIKPIINPMMLEPGSVGYPDENSIADVIGVNFQGDARAYMIRNLNSREVVDDLVGEQHLAATY